jgi:hypothetical protein
MALGQDRSIVLVGFAAMLWLVIREERCCSARSPGWRRAWFY